MRRTGGGDTLDQIQKIKEEKKRLQVINVCMCVFFEVKRGAGISEGCTGPGSRYLWGVDHGPLALARAAAEKSRLFSNGEFPRGILQ